MMNVNNSSYAYLNQPTLLLREEPNAESTVATEVFYSEEVQVIEERDNWLKIKTIVDGYEGWAEKKITSIIGCDSPYLTGSIARVQSQKAHIYSQKDTVYGPMATLPFRARVQVLEDDGMSRWIQIKLLNGSIGYIQRGNVEINPSVKTRDDMVAFAESMASWQSPYFFGGRTAWDGFDCSGLTQMLYYEFLGIKLPRDSKDQAKCEFAKTIPLCELQPGDLIFFGKNKDKITHVGMYTGNGKFVHANVRQLQGKISISSLGDDLWSGMSNDIPYRHFTRIDTSLDVQKILG